MKTAPILLVPALLALAACGPDFDPASEVQGLRVLAVRAEPPELAPPGDASAPSRAALDTLVAHPAFPSQPGRAATVLHVTCTPKPGDPAASSCTDLSELADPAALLGKADPASVCSTTPGRGVAGGITFSGLEACGLTGCSAVTVRREPGVEGSEVALPAPAYELPGDFSFKDVPAGAPERILGLEVVDLALALDATPAELAPTTAVAGDCEALVAFMERFAAEWEARPHVATVKRIRVRGPNARSAPNANPVLSGIALGGVALPAPDAAPAPVTPGTEADLLPILPGNPETLRETYFRLDAAGEIIEPKQEDWTFSWFSTTGELDRLHTNDATEGDRYTAPATGDAVIWSVVRDLRGGVAWQAAVIRAE
jgi:hypothetical protein